MLLGFLHFDILASIVFLLVGGWTLAYFQLKSRRFNDPGLNYLQIFLILLNLNILRSIFIHYFKINLILKNWTGFPDWIGYCLTVISSLILLGMTIYLIKTIAWLREKKLPQWFVPAVAGLGMLLTIMYLLTLRFPFLWRGPGTSYLIWDIFIWGLRTLEALWLIVLLAEIKHHPNAQRRTVVKAFGWMFLGYSMATLLIQILALLKFQLMRNILVNLLHLILNLIPICWLKFYYIPWAGSLGKITTNDVNIQYLQKAHGLTNRELEILNLLLDGKSYKQMEDMLFISLHTVKKHVYNLYRKMGVNSRHKLIHFITTLKQENG